MPSRIRLIGCLMVLSLTGTAVSAQDRRPVVEPAMPPACAVIAAPLRAGAAGPIVGGSVQREDAESARQTRLIQAALQGCRRGHAVRLSLGPSPAWSAFLIEPLTLPPGVSLRVDGGVTVFASRNPARFQMPKAPYRCGTARPGNPIYGGCRAMITLSSGSGVYGHGVLDGQAQRGLIRDDRFSPEAWWDLLLTKKNGCDGAANAGKRCEQASPPMIYAGRSAQGGQPHDLTLYRITLRNPPFHTVMLGGTGITIWGVKVQAPWNVPNSDGFDLNGTDILVHDVTVANGDQDVVVTAPHPGERTRFVTVEGATFYGKGGMALLAGDGAGIGDVLVDDLAMTGDVTSFKRRRQDRGGTTVLINGRDPKAMKLRGTSQRLASYGQALPTATGDLQGVQVDTNLRKTAQLPGFTFTDLTFRSVCLQDVVRPFRISPSVALPPDAPPAAQPIVQDIRFRDVRVLAPGAQFPAMLAGRVQPGSGSYRVDLIADPAKQSFNRFKLQNVVVDDLRTGGTSLGQLTARGNLLSTLANLYPRALNRLDAAPPGPPLHWTLADNRYQGRTGTADPGLAIPCPAGRWSFLAGELYLDRPTGTIPAGGPITLNAVLQPAMSQTTWFMPDSYGAKPGLLAIGAPALAKPVQFLDGGKLVGSGRLEANGTLATLTIRDPAPGRHTYTARYPGDAYYRPFAFGSVTVGAQ